MTGIHKSHSLIGNLGSSDSVLEGLSLSIYICAVGSITWPHFGQSRVNNLATVGSITWPPFFEPIKIGVLGDFWCTVFRGWCKISVFESCFW